MNDLSITPESVYSALKRIKGHRATGPDRIPVELVRHPATVGALAPEFAALLNRIVDTGVNPWSEFRVVPIPKGQSKGIRPIAIGAIGHKILDRLIADSLHAHLESRGGLCREQSAFIPGRNGTDPVASLLSHINDAWEHDRALLVVIADVEGAYDQVSRPRLHEVLRDRWQIPNRLARAIETAGQLRSALFESHQRRGEAVVVPVQDGLGQGRIASPLLFATYVDFIVAYCRRVPGAIVLAFADDFVFASSTAAGLQALLRAADAAAHWLRLRFAPRKSRFVAFGCAARVRQECKDFVPRFAGSDVPRTERVTYLGVDLDASGEQDVVAPHRVRVIGALRTAMLEVKRRLRFHGFATLGDALFAWRHACAAAEYASPVWITASPIDARTAFALTVNLISDELLWALAGVDGRDAAESQARLAARARREGELAIPISRVAAQLAIDMRIAPFWRRLRGLAASYLADRRLAAGLALPGQRPLPVGVSEGSPLVRELWLVADEVLRTAQQWRALQDAAGPTDAPERDARPLMKRAVSHAVFSPYLECLGLSEMPTAPPLWRASGVGLERQQRILRARSGLEHNAFLARSDRPSLGCRCEDALTAGSSVLTLCWHLIQCWCPTSGRRPDAEFASELVRRVEEKLPPAAAQEALRLLNDSTEDVFGMTRRLRVALDGPYFAALTRVVADWIDHYVYFNPARGTDE